MVKPDLVAAGKFDTIKELTREAMQNVLGFKLKHIGINSENPEESEKLAKKLCRLFGFSLKEGNSSNFAGNSFEIMKSNYLGKNGHIAIGTNSIERAVHYLEGLGIQFRGETAKKNEKGDTVAIYLKDEFGGFAFHLVQKS